ncbi:hypothetical protein IMZ48_09220 [Candidatus Bathyarchaeota archaeon]|nr:hypothetical protein [Candidatus Bathyarchaeota archaeon]
MLNGIAPGLATHSAEYSYFFGFPPDFDRHGTGPTVVDVEAHIRLSRGVVDILVYFTYTGNPNATPTPLELSNPEAVMKFY